MNYQIFNQITVKLRDNQKEWLYQEADRQMSNISVLVRQAIKLLMEKYAREAKQ